MAAEAAPFSPRRFLRNVALVVALAGVCAWAWFGFLRDRVVAKRFGEVTPSVFRSGQMSEHVVGATLERKGIRRIVDLTEPDYLPPGKVREYEVAKERQIDVLCFPLVGDGTGNVSVYTDAVAALIEADRSGEPTLVHCAAGTHRTGGVVAAFRMLYQGWTPEAALAEAERYDWHAVKDAEMAQYLARHIDEIRAGLIARGVLQPNAPRPVLPERYREPVTASAGG